MAAVVNFGGTLTAGIQNISALLPLLGTDQCEDHVGSALERGFLYSAVTPVSIFGSLGIVRASFKVLVASLSIRRYNFLGAKSLNHAGFIPSGIVAPMISLEPENGKRFIAETKLEKMLADQHIDNIEDLTLEPGDDVVRWNVLLVLSTLFISVIGLTPYIHIITESGETRPKFFFPLGFGFPVLRVFGSVLCVIIAQFLIQIRLLVILRSRLVFNIIDRLAREEKPRLGAGDDPLIGEWLQFSDDDIHDIEELSSEISRRLKGTPFTHAWAPDHAAEHSLWALQEWLATVKPTSDTPNKSQKIKALYETQYNRHLSFINSHAPPWVIILLSLCLTLACLSTVVGYIGCFFLIQHSAVPNGPVLWLVLEVVLSILRILVWAINPSWDDSKGIFFSLKLSDVPPMITCNRSRDHVLDKKTHPPLCRQDEFLQEVVAYTGLLPSFEFPGAELYYTFVANFDRLGSANDTSAFDRTLFLVIYAHKEQTSRTLFKDLGAFQLRECSMYSVSGNSAMNLVMGQTTAEKTHFLTANSAFMDAIKSHYEVIDNALRTSQTRKEPKTFFGTTWALRSSQTLTAHADVPYPQRLLADSPRDLTAAELSYIRLGFVQQRRSAARQLFQDWVDNQVDAYRERLASELDNIPPMIVESTSANKTASFIQRFEAVEKAFMLLECWKYFGELSLSTRSEVWDQKVMNECAEMLLGIKNLFDNPTFQDPRLRTTLARQNKLLRRLIDEYYFISEQETQQEESAQSKLVAADSGVQQLPAPGFGYTESHQITLGEGFALLRAKLIRTKLLLPGVPHASEKNDTHSPIKLEDSGTQRKAFMVLMRSRYLDLGGISIIQQLPPRDLVVAKEGISQMIARCNSRADGFFNMLANFELNFQRLIEAAPGYPNTLDISNDAFDIVILEQVLDKASITWRQEVQGKQL